MRVTINFGGLSLFVRDTSPGTGKELMHIVMPKSEQHVAMGMPLHLPMIACDVGHLTPGGTKTGFIGTKPISGAALALKQDPRSGAGDLPPASVVDLTVESGRAVLKDVLTGKPGDHMGGAGFVSGRFRLGSGTLRIKEAGLCHTVNGTNRRMPTVVACDIVNYPDNKLEFELLIGEDPVLPLLHEIDGAIEIFILNVPIDEWPVFGVFPNASAFTQSPNHFMTYNDVTDGTTPVPDPVLNPTGCGPEHKSFRGVNPFRCMVAQATKII